MTTVDITGLDKDVLLRALWTRSQPASFFELSGVSPPPFNLNKAKCQLQNGYADYVCGRVINADIYNKDTVNPSNYDRDNGIGAFAEVVTNLRTV